MFEGVFEGMFEDMFEDTTSGGYARIRKLLSFIQAA